MLCGLLLLTCLAAIFLDARERRRWAAVARTWKLEAHQPAIWATAGIIDDNSEAATVVAEGLLNSSGATPSGEVGSRAAARGVVLDGLEGRPGSVHALDLLGRMAAPGEPVKHWARPLELAAAAAPGLDFAADELGRRYLAAWETLSPTEQKQAQQALHQAFRDPAFVDSAFLVVVEKLGPEKAVSLVPDDALALGIAERLLGNKGLSGAQALAAARLKALPAERASRTGP